jgi:hypothetical protein
MLFSLRPPRRRRRSLYISDFNDKKVKKKISVEKIDGEEIGGEKVDESVNMEKSVEEIIEEIGRKIVRIRSDKKVKRIRISLPYHGEMEDRLKKGLGRGVKPKIA